MEWGSTAAGRSVPKKRHTKPTELHDSFVSTVHPSIEPGQELREIGKEKTDLSVDMLFRKTAARRR